MSRSGLAPSLDRPHLRGEVPLPRLAVERLAQMLRLYRNWPTALADRLGLLPGHRRVLYRVHSPEGSADLIARTNGCDVRTITEIWIGGFYDRLVEAGTAPDASPLVLDIGANCGYFAAYIARRHPQARIVCFEPDAGNRSIAAANLSLNCPRGELRPEAVVAGHETSLLLNLSDDPRLHTTVPPSGAASHGISSDRYNGSSVSVAAVNINDAIRRVGECRIALLKIDVEGIDLDLVTSIEPDLLARIDCVVAETEDRDILPAKRHLEASGFTVSFDVGLLSGTRRLAER